MKNLSSKIFEANQRIRTLAYQPLPVQKPRLEMLHRIIRIIDQLDDWFYEADEDDLL